MIEKFVKLKSLKRVQFTLRKIDLKETSQIEGINTSLIEMTIY